MGIYAQHKDDIAAVLTDMAMPLLDGPGTIRAIRRVSPEIDIVAMSGILNAEQTVELEGLNVTSHQQSHLPRKNFLMLSQEF
jgi:DNA-binding NtrC family response regulator